MVMKIAVVGSGYIGLVSGVCLANIGHQVICTDKDAARIAMLRMGHVPIFEPGLAEMMAEMMKEGRLSFSTDTPDATRKSEVIMIGVGTPTSADGVTSDLSYVYSAARDIAAGADGFKVVITKSTVAPGTNARILAEIKKARPGCDVEIASNPEFLREGSAIFDFMHPDRIVIGAETPRALAALEQIYAHFENHGCTILRTGLASAELIKFASNGFLATKIAFINEVAELCEKTGANVKDVALGMGLDERIGPRFLQAGPGFGGSCFPKDLRAMAAIGKEVGAQQNVIEAAILANEHAKARMVDKIEALANGNLQGKTLAVFGVTFKPDTDDMREAPALTILPELARKGAALNVVDPEGRKHGAGLLPMARWFDDPYAAAKDADMVVVLTEWNLFRTLDLHRLAKSMRQPTIADLRRIFAMEALEAAGFTKIYKVGLRPPYPPSD